MLLHDITITLTLLVFIVYLTYNYVYSFWKRRHTPYVKPLPVLGNLLDLLLLRVSFGEFFQQLYEHPDLSHTDCGGIYLLYQPALIVKEPALIKKLLIKDFDKFLNRFEAADYTHDRMGALTLPLSKYPIWHTSRRKMSEIFTTGRIKNRMYPLMLKVAKQLECCLLRQFDEAALHSSTIEIEVKEMFSLFTTDLTSLLHYGVDMNGLKIGHSPLRQQTKELFTINLKKVYNFFVVFFLPHLATLLKAKVFTQSYSHSMRQFTLKIMQQRQHVTWSSLTHGDLLDVLQKFQRDNAYTLPYTQDPDFIPSQVAIFLLAGSETSSSVMGFILYELAKCSDIQQRLRLELKEAFKQDEFLTYEKLQSLTYLHQVVCEGLRMYPAAAFINRECTPTKAASKGFFLKSDLFIPKGMPVYISILGLHRDPKHWPNPSIFQPERFAPNNLPTIKPMTYLPFGAGPHGCIGSRLGLLQVKLGLAHVLKVCEEHQCRRTRSEIKFDATSFMLQAKGGIYFQFKKDQ